MERRAAVIRYKETVARIIADERYLPAAKREIEGRYESILEYARRHPDFITSLAPLPADGSAPEIVRRMLDAGRRAGVGPMAAVAGAVAEFALRAMLEAGADEALVENGGDIAMFIKQPVIIPLFTGPSSLKGLGLKIRPAGRIMGLCTSSGTVGHSLSFGKADAAVVLAEDAALSDAAATSLGNAVRERDERSLEQALGSSWLDGVEGMLAVAGDLLAVKGKMPEIVSIAEETIKKRDAGCRANEGENDHE